MSACLLGHTAAHPLLPSTPQKHTRVLSKRGEAGEVRLRGILRSGVHRGLPWEGDGWQEYLMQFKVPAMNKPGETEHPAGAEVGQRFCGGTHLQGNPW